MPVNEHLVNSILSHLQRTCLDNMIEGFFCFVAALFSVLKKKKPQFSALAELGLLLWRRLASLHLNRGFIGKGLHMQGLLLLQANSTNLDGYLLPEALLAAGTLLWEFRGAQHHSPHCGGRPQPWFLNSQQCLNGKKISYGSACGQRATYVLVRYAAIFKLAPFEYKAVEMTYPKKYGPLPLCATANF